MSHAYNTRSKSSSSQELASLLTSLPSKKKTKQSKKITKPLVNSPLPLTAHHHTTQIEDLNMMHYDVPPPTILRMDHHHQTMPLKEPWSTPLFSCEKLLQYATTMLCPCTVFYKIIDSLILSENRSDTVRFTCQETTCSVLSYTFFPCIYFLYNKNDSNGEEIWSEEETFCHQYLLDYIYYHPPPPPPPEPYDNLFKPPDRPLFLVCLASGCMIPATCLLRQIVSHKKASKYHSKKESLWTSGIVSCLLWPCALVQVEEELHTMHN